MSPMMALLIEKTGSGYTVCEDYRRVPVALAMAITSADGDDYVATMGDNRNKADETNEADRTD